MKAKTKWKIGVGGTHFSPTALGLGISAPHPRTQNAEFGLGLGGGTKVFYPLRPDYRRFKIPSFTSPGHTHSHVCAPFSFCRIVGNPLSSRYFMHYRIYSQYHILRIFLGHCWPLVGGGGMLPTSLGRHWQNSQLITNVMPTV